MRDLRFLSVTELERFLVNLKQENENLLKKPNRHFTQEETIKWNASLISHVEAEILERTLLDASNDDGCSD